jgi:hypothetical protein
MSRYECSRAADTAVEVLAGREAVLAGVLYPREVGRGEFAVVLGDPGATAYAISGTPHELRALLGRVAARLDAAAGGAPRPDPDGRLAGRQVRDCSGADDGLGRVYSDTEFDAPGF